MILKTVIIKTINKKDTKKDRKQSDFSRESLQLIES